MKKNHFIYSYAGNKRQEVEHIIGCMSLKSITTIIEPFCGSSAVSYYISTLYPKKYNYVLNDLDDKLIMLYNCAKDPEKLQKLEDDVNILIIDINKEKYKNIIKNDTLESHIVKNKIYAIRPGLFPLDYKHKKIDLVNCPIVKFLQTENVNITSEDGILCYNRFKDDKHNMLFIDPPYLISCNDLYTNKQNCNIYEYLHKNDIKKEKAQIILCLENNWIIQLLFNKHTKKLYDKKYEMSKKKTQHVVITNKKIN